MGARVRLAAIGLYGAYWGLWLFGVLDFHRGDFPQVSREVFYALAVGLPCFLVGAAIGRWSAPAVGLFFVVFALASDRCETVRLGDTINLDCYGLAAADLPFALAVTTPCVLAGVAFAKLLRMRSGRRAERLATP